MLSPEDKAGETIDNLLTSAGWQVFDVDRADMQAFCMDVGR